MNRKCRFSLFKIKTSFSFFDQTRTADAATLINIAQRLGGALGAIAMVAALEQFSVSAPGTSYQVAFGALIIISFGALLAATRIAASHQRGKR